ncbi:nucleoside hydrolase [Nibrella saemangeumensis]
MKLLLFLCFLLLGQYTWAQYRVILDTDIDSDVDDVEALAMLHVLADQKKIDFLGVIVTSDDPYAPTCTAAINTYYGRPDLPVSFLRNQKEISHQAHYKYTKEISQEFPHRLKSHEEAEDAVALYRKLLSSSPDASVIVVTVGHLSSWQQLLQSGADQYSTLTGLELARKKLANWYCMGGQFPSGKEANFYRPDPASTQYCLQTWDKPVIFCGWEIGKQITTGGPYLKSKLPSQSPVYRAYALYNGFAGRPSWDQVAVFLLIEQAKAYFDTIKTGYCHINADGSNEWRADRDSLHEYLVFKPGVNPDEIARFMDTMVVR